MKIKVEPDKELSNGYYRFSVQIVSDDDAPLASIAGFRLTPNRRVIIPPQTITSRGMVFPAFTILDTTFHDALRDAILAKISPSLRIPQTSH